MLYSVTALDIMAHTVFRMDRSPSNLRPCVTVLCSDRERDLPARPGFEGQ
jgi:hypothetical protein